MLPIELLREQAEMVKEKVATKGADPALVDRFIELDESWRDLRAKADELRRKQNELSKERKIEEARTNKQELKKVEEELRGVEEERQSIWWQLPNIPDDDVPVGEDEEGNKVVRTWGAPPTFDFEPKDHVELGELLGIIDTETAAEVSGARFAYLKGDLVLLEFALMDWALAQLCNQEVLEQIAKEADLDVSAKPFTPVLPPVMIRPETYRKAGRLSSDNKDDKFYIEKDDLYLIGSAEHTLAPMHMDEQLSEGDLPLRYVGFSTSFRREAGSYGKDTRGILRMHQFNKLEMLSFSTSEAGRPEHDFFVAIQEYLMQQLELPYQVVELCTGDMGTPNVRQKDIETWVPTQGTYRETHSADYVTDYQSRRLNTKVQLKGGDVEFVHMNDATVFSQRPLIAILENNQQEDGSVTVPEVLRPYVGKNRINPLDE